MAKKVLVVEDERAVLALIVQMLGLMGHVPVSASDCASATALWSEQFQQIHLAIVDYSLPDGLGTTLVERFLTDRPDLPLFLTSGYTPELLAITPKIRDRIIFVAKPFNIINLRNQIAALLPNESSP